MDFDNFFGRDVINKVGSQKTLYYAVSNNLCFCTTWQNGNTRKSHFSLKCRISQEHWSSRTVLHTQCCLSERKNRQLILPSDSPVNTSWLHRVSKNVPPLAYYNFDTHKWILIFFWQNVTDKVGS